MARRALTLTLTTLLLLGAALAASAQEDPPEPPPAPKAKLTEVELEKRLATVKLTVDWKDKPVIEAVSEVQQKSGLKLFYDADLANYLATRKVTLDGYAITARDALGVLSRAGGFDIQTDAEQGGFRLRRDPVYATRAALEEKKVTVNWTDMPVDKAVVDLQKKTGFSITIHETMKKRLSGRKITWYAVDVTAKEAIQTLYVYPPPSVEGRIDLRENMKVLIVYDGKPETRADVELLLDGKTIDCELEGATIMDIRKFFKEKLAVEVDPDPKFAGKRVTYKAKAVSPRTALDAIAKELGGAWRHEGAKILIKQKA